MLPFEPQEELMPTVPDQCPPEEPQSALGGYGLPPLQAPFSPLACVSIIGQIEGHTALPPQSKATQYEHLLPLLLSIEQDPRIEGFLVLLNTAGGDVEAGLALAEMIAGMQKPSVSLVLGGGHSIGVPLAVSTRASFIAPSAAMTLHPIRMTGLVIGATQTYDYLNKMQQRICGFITAHSKITPQTLRTMMQRTGDMPNDVGTVLVGEEAVQCGLIGAVGTLHGALTHLRALCDAQKDQRAASAPQ